MLHDPPSAAPIGFDLLPSRSLACALAAAHAGGAAALWMSAAPPWLAAPLLVLAAASLARALRRHALRRAPDAAVRLEWGGGGGAPRVVRADGGACGMRPRAPPFVHPRLVILRLEPIPGLAADGARGARPRGPRRLRGPEGPRGPWGRWSPWNLRRRMSLAVPADALAGPADHKALRRLLLQGGAGT